MKKSKGIMPMDSTIMPSLSLEGEHAKKFIKHKLGKKLKLVVHGTKTRHSIYNDRHSIGIDIHKVSPLNEVDMDDKDEKEEKD